MCTQAQWILKKGITAQVPVPGDPGPYIGDTNILNAAHKQALKLYEEYEEHKRNTNKAIQACFDEDLFIELETDGLLLGVSPHEVYQHMYVDEFHPDSRQRPRNSTCKRTTQGRLSPRPNSPTLLQSNQWGTATTNGTQRNSNGRRGDPKRVCNIREKHWLKGRMPRMEPRNANIMDGHEKTF